jgi:hypothetical protein
MGRVCSGSSILIDPERGISTAKPLKDGFQESGPLAGVLSVENNFRNYA